MKHWLHAGFAALLAISGCQQPSAPPPALHPAPHYTLGKPYNAGGHWFYPAEEYALESTGIASVLPNDRRLTADGELFDASALVAAMPTLQLPAIARVTNLENGREIMLRVNDRGPGNPGRIIALSPRAALLLQIPQDGAARVRVEVDTRLSHNAVDQVGGGPRLAISTAPAGTVTAQALPPPGSTANDASAAPAILGTPRAAPQEALVPDRMPERIIAGRPNPMQLWLRAGSFGRYTYANVLAARLGGLGGTVLRSREGRQETYAVRAGPFATIAQADVALRSALAAGVVDARISVEDE